MKKILLAMMVLGSMMAAQGQQNEVLTATLQHGNELTVFKMANALNQAINAAEDGDVITLSEGTFNAVNINKSITIYGAGFEDNEATGTRATIINGEFCMAISGQTISVHIEGCYFNSKIYAGAKTGSMSATSLITSLEIQKCYLNKGANLYCPITDAVFSNCVVADYLWGTSNYALTSLQFNNCFIYRAICGYPDLSPIIVDHCIFPGEGRSGAYYFSNCIFCSNYTDIFSAGAVLKNCVGRYSYGSAIYAENCYFSVGSNIFTDSSDGTYSQGCTWALQQPDVWIGDDGTEVGINGGQGWSSVPRIPVIKSLDLNVEGQQLKLNFEAEVRE
jgi:hypothetical protein